MSNLINLYSESGADMIGDDAQPTLELVNTSTGAALRAKTIDVGVGTTGVTIRRAVVGNISIGVLRVQGNSLASGAMLEFTGNRAFASITSVVLTTVANTDYAIRVQVGLETRWIPLFKDAAIIGAAVPEA